MVRAARGCLILLLLTFGSAAHAQGYRQPLEQIAQGIVSKLDASLARSGTVLDFTDLQGQPTELGRFLAQEFSDALVTRARRMVFVDRTNLQYLLKEHSLSVDGLINPASSKRLGQLIGIDTLIFGTITPLGSELHLSVRAVSVETGRIIVANSSSIPATTELATMLNRGVAADGVPAPSGGQPAQPELRPAAFIGKITQLNVSQQRNMGVDNPYHPYAYTVHAGFTLQNASGKAASIAVRREGFSIGSCSEPLVSVGSIPLVTTQTMILYAQTQIINDAALRQSSIERDKMYSLPAGGETGGAIVLGSTDNSCSQRGIASSGGMANLSLVISDGGGIRDFPVQMALPH